MSLLPFCVSGRLECGTDEAGRGALCGPVVAAAVIWPPELQNSEIRDSKKLSRHHRERLAAYIKEHAIAYAVEFVDNHVIDEVNILKATYRAMHGAIATIAQTHTIDMILVDGNRFQSFNDIPHTCVIKGDNTYLSIAAASILAKVARDEHMTTLAAQEPYKHYHLDKNAGYGTPEHIRAIQNHGPSDIHRMTFRKCTLYSV